MISMLGQEGSEVSENKSEDDLVIIPIPPLPMAPNDPASMLSI